MEFISPEYLVRYGGIALTASILFEAVFVAIRNNWSSADAPSRTLVVNYFTACQKLFRSDCYLNSSNHFHCSDDQREKEMKQQ